MKCPHCLVEFHDELVIMDLLHHSKRLVERVPERQHQTSWRYATDICPACGQAIVLLLRQHPTPLGYANESIPECVNDFETPWARIYCRTPAVKIARLTSVASFFRGCRDSGPSRDRRPWSH
jgi:hypothetical protein